jgi:hypothetical protein
MHHEYSIPVTSAKPGKFAVTVIPRLPGFSDLACTDLKIINLTVSAESKKSTLVPSPVVAACPNNQPRNASGNCPNSGPCNSQAFLLNPDGTCGQACPATHLRNNNNQCVCISGYTDNGNPNGQCAPVSGGVCTQQIIAKCKASIVNSCPEACSNGQYIPTKCKP